MALASGKVSAGQMVIDRVCGGTDPSARRFSKHCQLFAMNSTRQGAGWKKLRNGHGLQGRLRFLTGGSCKLRQRSGSPAAPRIGVISCMSTGTCNGERKECSRKSKKRNEFSDDGTGSSMSGHHVINNSRSTDSSRGLAEAYKFACNDAKYVNERARNDIVLLSRGVISIGSNYVCKEARTHPQGCCGRPDMCPGHTQWTCLENDGVQFVFSLYQRPGHILDTARPM